MAAACETKTINQILAEPQLSALAFRLNPGGLPTEELNRLNRSLMKRINARKRVLLTGTLLRGQFVIRICVLSFRTHRDRMILCLEDIREAADPRRISSVDATRSAGSWRSSR